MLILPNSSGFTDEQYLRFLRVVAILPEHVTCPGSREPGGPFHKALAMGVFYDYAIGPYRVVNADLAQIAACCGLCGEDEFQANLMSGHWRCLSCGYSGDAPMYWYHAKDVPHGEGERILQEMVDGIAKWLPDIRDE